MKKNTTLLFCLLFFIGFAQSKSTGVINLTSNMTANFTLNKATSKATLVLTGPSDRWFAMGLGVALGFNMAAGDCVVYGTAVTDRNFIGFGFPTTDASQDWVTISNVVASGTRTLILERALTNTDAKDFQMPYNSTNSINLAWAHSSIATTNLGGHLANRGFASGTFTTLGVEDFSLNATSVYPNPSSESFFIKTKATLSTITLYNQSGTLIKKIDVKADVKEIELSATGISSGVYFLELQNDSEKTWKKVIVD